MPDKIVLVQGTGTREGTEDRIKGIKGNKVTGDKIQGTKVDKVQETGDRIQEIKDNKVTDHLIKGNNVRREMIQTPKKINNQIPSAR